MTAPIVVQGDARALPLPDCSVDAVVCDPPYELSFMGRSWDSTGVAFDTEPWREALRVLKPGGHLAAFGATRTYHRLGCAIEDAGFEIRDSIRAGVYAWVHGQGFPKSLDVGKAMSKVGADAATVREIKLWLADRFAECGKTKTQINRECGFTASDYLKTEPGNDAGGRATWHLLLPYGEKWTRLREVVGFGDHWDAEIEQYGRIVGRDAARAKGSNGIYGEFEGVTSYAATDAARTWDGWGTALKPAWEPIVVARKPLDGTVAASVLAHGTGAINIDACRVNPGTLVGGGGNGSANVGGIMGPKTEERPRVEAHDAGRFPSNLLISHHPDCGDGCHELCHVRALDEQSGTRTSGTTKASHADSDGGRSGGIMGAHTARQRTRDWAGDTGGASRYYPTFRYEPKAPTWQRPQVDGRGFETVKPLDLMRWLVRLLTPPGGLVLDMFPGTGTTGQAAQLEGFRSLLVELEAAHIPFIRERLAQQVVVDRKTDEAVPVTPAPDDALSLFDLEAS